MKYKALITILFLISLTTATNLTITTYSGAGLPIANITITAYNSTNDLQYENTTNILGNATITDAIGDEYTIRLDYPSSAYSARIDYINNTEKVFLEDTYGATLRLVNTLGQPLEAQDCAIAVYRNDTNQLIKAYDTTCRQGERYIDSSGNWASITKCPLTDSNGYYYFTTKITEADGYEYGRYYTTKITCNAKTASTTFYVDVRKPPDMDMWIDLIVRYGGLAILFIIGVILAIIVILGVIGVALALLKRIWKTIH